MLLVPRERIAAVSFIADDPEVSTMAAAAAGLAKVHSEAEEVLVHDPDLVLDGALSIRPTVGLLRRLGFRVETVPVSSGLEGIRENVRTVGRFTGTEAEAARLIADFDRRLAALPPEAPGPRPSALVYFIGSNVAGSETLEDAVLQAAGFRNFAADKGLFGLSPMPLETLIADPPDLIVLSTGAENYRTNVADNLRHPALKALLETVPSLRIDPALMVCDTPRIIDAIELLARTRVMLAHRGEVQSITVPQDSRGGG